MYQIYYKSYQSQEKFVYEFFNSKPVHPDAKVAIIVFMRKPIDLSLWLKHHRELGITKFYIRVEDTPELESYLKLQPDVWLEMGDSDKNGDNYQTLFDRQVVFINNILDIAKQDNIDWVFNVDVDELLHGSLKILDELPEKINCLVIQNAEAIFSENETTCFSAVKFLRCAHGAPCRAYANGKSGARVVDGVKSTGVHRFMYNNSTIGPTIISIDFNQLHILHFDSCSLGSWIEKYYHLSKNKVSKIPFPYYHESINASLKAYNVYKKHTINHADDVSESMIYYKNE